MPQDQPRAQGQRGSCRAVTESRGLDGPGMSHFWHKMGCCVVAKPPPVRHTHTQMDTHSLSLSLFS